MTSEKTYWVELAVTGERMPSYVAEPAAAPRGGIIVLQEIFGVVDNIRRVVELLADTGYLAIAPALFHRTDPHFEASLDARGFARGRAAADALDLAQLTADVTAATDYLSQRLGSQRKVGVWGFCFGGSIAYLAATLPSVGAAVSFYGGQIAHGSAHRPALVELTAQLGAPLFLAYGGRDEHITPDHVEAVRQALEAHERTFDLRVYADEDHGFFRNGPESNAGSRDVWPRVRAFFAEHLT